MCAETFAGELTNRPMSCPVATRHLRWKWQRMCCRYGGFGKAKAIQEKIFTSVQHFRGTCNVDDTKFK